MTDFIETKDFTAAVTDITYGVDKHIQDCLKSKYVTDAKNYNHGTSLVNYNQALMSVTRSLLNYIKEKLREGENFNFIQLKKVVDELFSVHSKIQDNIPHNLTISVFQKEFQALIRLDKENNEKVKTMLQDKEVRVNRIFSNTRKRGNSSIGNLETLFNKMQAEYNQGLSIKVVRNFTSDDKIERTFKSRLNETLTNEYRKLETESDGRIICFEKEYMRKIVSLYTNITEAQTCELDYSNMIENISERCDNLNDLNTKTRQYKTEIDQNLKANKLDKVVKWIHLATLVDFWNT